MRLFIAPLCDILWALKSASDSLRACNTASGLQAVLQAPSFIALTLHSYMWLCSCFPHRTTFPTGSSCRHCNSLSQQLLTVLTMTPDAAGIYVLYDDGRNVRLLYELEVPIYPQEAQEVLAIYKTGDYSVQVRVRRFLIPCWLQSSEVSVILLQRITDSRVSAVNTQGACGPSFAFPEGSCMNPD